MASLLRSFTWSSFSKARGWLRGLAPWPRLQRPLLLADSRALLQGYHYCVRASLLWTDGLFELRDDPESYLYYYFGEQLNFLQLLLREMEIPFTLLDNLALEKAHPDLYVKHKLTAESDYFSSILCFLPSSMEPGENQHSSQLSAEELEEAKKADRTARVNASMLSFGKETSLWSQHRSLDSYLTPYFSRHYSSQS